MTGNNPVLAKLKAARDIAANAENAARELTEDERKSISEHLAQAQELNAKALSGASTGVQGKSMTAGNRFVKSDEYQHLLKSNPNGFGKNTPVSMGQVQIPGGMKALITSSGQTEGDASNLIQPQRLGLVDYPYVGPKMREVITNGTTTSDRIEYAQMIPTADNSGTVNAAKGVKEAPATTGTVGVKPESSLAIRKASADVITIAHWLPATKKALSDAAQIRTLIDGFLSRGLEEEVERMIINGDKDAPTKGEEEWDGIFNTTGVQHQAFDGDLVKTVRRAISKVTVKGAQVNSVLVSPEMAEELDLLKDSTGRYLGAGPWSVGPGTIWGRPMVIVPALSGTKKFVLGDLSTCVLWDREQANITVTDSHADFFVRNLVAILAEMCAGFGILNPSLLVIGDTAAA